MVPFLSVIKLPVALSWNKTCPSPNTTSGYTPQQTTARTKVTKMDARSSEIKFFIILNELQRGNDDIDDFDSNERNDDSAETINEQVALQNRQRPDGLIHHASESERNQGDNNQSIENHRTENGTGRSLQM